MTIPLSPASFAVIVVNYGSSDLLEHHLVAAAASTVDALTVVVDNFSTSYERERIADLCRRFDWVLVAAETNLGFGAGVNLGVHTAASRGVRRFIALNPDAMADAHTLDALADHVRRHPKSLVAPLIQSSEGRTFFAGAQVSIRSGQIRTQWDTNDQDPEWKNWLTGACLAFDLDAFEAADAMSDDYFLYWEDVDFSRRAASAGARLDLRTDLVVIHDEGGTHNTSRTRAKSDLYYYYNCRNRLWFGRLHGRSHWRHWIMSTPRQSLNIWLRGGRRQLLSHPTGAWAAVRGTIAGLFSPPPGQEPR